MAKSRLKKWIRRTIVVLIVLGVVLGGAFVFIFRPYSFGDPPQIPQGWGASFAPSFIGAVATPKPISEDLPPAHPFLANGNSCNMHVDSYASDVHPRGGPLGNLPKVITYAHGAVGGEIACVTFDRRGNIMAVGATFKEFALLLLRPSDLKPLARFSLPPRSSNKTLNIRNIMSDTSGGAYFFLDNEDRAVLVDAAQRLRVIGQEWQGDHVELVLRREYELLPVLEAYTSVKDVITSVLPDWHGNYWFVSRKGLIGIVTRDTGKVRVLRLDNEEIQNSFAVDETGVYLVSDRALYGITCGPDDHQPKIMWREEYERAQADKPGTLTRGSGTTPTLVGERFVAIADNADPCINVLIYRRDVEFNGKRLIAKVPVFSPGASATENTLIGIGNSLVIENNYGYDIFPTMMFGKTGAGGVARVDFSEETGEATVVWTNPIISQTTVPKLSLETGLVYLYAKDSSVGWGVDAFYLAAVDFETGETIFRVLTGTGVSFDNNWAPITLGPDRSAYVGVLRGLIKVTDTGGQDDDSGR